MQLPRPGKRVLAASVALILSAGTLTACAKDNTPEASHDEKITVTDATGAKLDVPSHAERIVCLTAICDDALTELGLRPAASNNSQPEGLLAQEAFLGPEAAKEVPFIDGAFGEENLEQVIAADPQFVVGLEGAHDGLVEPLKNTAPTYMTRISKTEDSVEFLKMMGRITGREKEADEAVSRFEQTLKDAEEKTKGHKVTVLGMYGEDKNFGVDTKDSVLGSVLQRLGNYPWETPPGQHEGHSAGMGTFSIEEVARKNPEVIFVQTFSYGPVKTEPISQQLANDPVWKTIKAVREGHVIEVPTVIWAEGRGTRSLGIVAKDAAATIAEIK